MRRSSGWLAPLRLLAPALTVAAAAWLLLADPAWLQALRNDVFDQYQRLRPRAYVDAPVRIVDVDEESLARLGQWPWPRTRLAELVQRLRQAQAAAIGFDVVFAEPDRTSPRQLRDLWPLPPEARAALDYLPDHDAVFADALRSPSAGESGGEGGGEGGGVVLGFSLERGTAPAANPPAAGFTPRARFVQMGEPPERFVPAFDRIVAPLPLLADAAAGQGALSFVPDGDGVVRRVPLLLRVGPQLLPSLTAELLRVGQGATNDVVRTAPAAGAGIAEVRIGALALPTTRSGELWAYFTQPEPRRTIPAWQLLAGQAPAEALRGHLVLVGSSAQGLMDLRFSPLGSVIPGVEVHAQVLEQALSDGFLHRPDWALAVEALALVIAGLVVGYLALLARALVSAAAATLAVGALFAAGWFAFTGHRLLLDPLTPSLGIVLAFALPSVISHYASERRQRWVREAFSRYVSPNLVTHIVEHPEQLELGGRRQVCSFIFTDLAGFTGLLEKMDPGAAVGLLNTYLDEMIAIAFRHQGTLDRIVGDAVAIMFSAPVPQDDHRERALRCALEMQRYATRYAAELQARGIAFGHTRIGVHCGEVIVGNFGGSTIFDYRALGDPVNTAARLEGANKYFGTRLCVSAAIVDGCPGAAVRRIGRVVLKGKQQPLLVYQPLGNGLEDAGQGRDAPRADYEAAYDLLATDAAEAARAFEQLLARWPDDPLVRLHAQRLRDGESGDTIVLRAK